MAANKFFLHFLMLLAFAGSLHAIKLGSIGAVSPNYPPIEQTIHRPSPITVAFLNDLMYLTTSAYGDAAIAVMNNMNIQHGSIQHKDIYFQGRALRTADENEENIREFYEEYKVKGKNFLREVASKNKSDVILMSLFNPSNFKKVFNERKNQSITELSYKLELFDLQTGGIKNSFIKIEVEDLFGYPDSNPQTLLTVFENAYIDIFTKAFGHLQKTGGNDFSALPTSSSAPEEDVSEKAYDVAPAATSTAPSAVKSGGDDW